VGKAGDVEYLRDLGRKIRQVPQYPQRRPRGWRRPPTRLEEHSIGPIEVGTSGPDARLDHRDLMFIVGVAVALLALGLLLALVALLQGWF
jgi:hypothetical protein